MPSTLTFGHIAFDGAVPGFVPGLFASRWILFPGKEGGGWGPGIVLIRYSPGPQPPHDEVQGAKDAAGDSPYLLCFFSSLAQESLSVVERLNTGAPGLLSFSSAQK